MASSNKQKNSDASASIGIVPLLSCIFMGMYHKELNQDAHDILIQLIICPILMLFPIFSWMASNRPMAILSSIPFVIWGAIILSKKNVWNELFKTNKVFAKWIQGLFAVNYAIICLIFIRSVFYPYPDKQNTETFNQNVVRQRGEFYFTE